MKNHVRLALLCLAATAAPAMAQAPFPQCGTSNFDSTRSVFTIMNATPSAVNQQCYITVYPAGRMPAQAQQFPSSYLAEGSYAIELSGGGGGGGAGAPKDEGGGGGGAGAAPSRTQQYLSPGVYKLTLGTGGDGGVSGGRSGNGNPTSLTRVDNGQLIAGYDGADMASKSTQSAVTGTGGVAAAGGSRGGSGGDSGSGSEERAQAGGQLQTSGYSGNAGQSGSESGRSATTDSVRAVQANAGGGGGAGVGSGGGGGSSDTNSASSGSLGGGGGGGSGGVRTAESGARGGDGFIRLSMLQATPAPVAAPVIVAAPAPVYIAPAPVIQRYSMSSDALFGFNQSSLTTAGEGKLDQLIAKLKSVDIDTITNTGHADRIGNDEHNQQLSVARAEAVKTYMVRKGVQSNRNSVVGKGESQPVTGTECKGPTSAKLIACLAPDRRVDVEVTVSNRTVSLN